LFGFGLVLGLLGGMPLFGGEDPLGPAPDGSNWHHEGLTRRAAQSAGWSPAAENSVAFHADYVDSYLYNPLWWLNPADGGGPERLRIVMSSQADLIKVHFDDLFAPEPIRAMWRRYLSGTVCGLLWVARQDLDRDVKVAMAHNIVGVSLHALEDFESHSNWIDDATRRQHTWFETSRKARNGYSLYTGSYEKPDHLGVKPHGKYEFACTVLNNVGGVGRGLLRVACHAASPLAGSPLCVAVARCDETQSINPPQVAGADPPDGLLYIVPGINVDNHWMAAVGVQQRGLTLTGDEAFGTAYSLAYRTACQWLHILGHLMENAGFAEFWTDVMTRGTTRERYTKDVAPWERLDQIPYRFISTGPYPPVLDPPDTGQWYLRLSVATADLADAGTNADLVAFVDDARVEPLDQGPKPAGTEVDGLLGFDDHERGSTTAYYLGPFVALPQRLAILNDAPSTVAVIAAAGRAVLNAVVAFFTSIAGFFLGLVGAAADFVGQAYQVIDATQLEGLATGASIPVTLRCNGGTEGIYIVSGRVEATAVTGTDAAGIPWREYLVRMDDLFCEKESEWDRFTTSDEPFVVGVVIPHGAGSSSIPWRTEPFSDVDTGEQRTIGRVFSVRVARRFGFLSVAVATYESDDESPGDRDNLMSTFAGTATAMTAAAEKQFGVVLAEAIASGWRPARVDVAAFRRGSAAEVVSFAPFEPDRWVYGGERLEWTLHSLDHLTVEVPDTIDCDCLLDCGTIEVPARPEPKEPIHKRPRPGRPKWPRNMPRVGVEGSRGRSRASRAVK
jgi:hypothetical protein